MPLQNILVPIDFSPCSVNALAFAIPLAKASGARLTLLNCYTVLVNTADTTIDLHPQASYEFEKNAKESFERLKTQLPDLEEVNHQLLTRMNFINDGIYHVTKSLNPELIVMGTRGADSRMDSFFGSNTYNTIKKSKVPVITVPEEAKFHGLRSLLFAADFRPIKNIETLGIVKALAKLFIAEIQILHIGGGWEELNKTKTKEAAKVVQYFTETDHTYHFMKKKKDVAEGIDQHLEYHSNELLILIARKHHFPGTLFKKRVTKKTAMHTALPLLTIPD